MPKVTSGHFGAILAYFGPCWASGRPPDGLRSHFGQFWSHFGAIFRAFSHQGLSLPRCLLSHFVTGLPGVLSSEGAHSRTILNPRRLPASGCLWEPPRWPNLRCTSPLRHFATAFPDHRGPAAWGRSPLDKRSWLCLCGRGLLRLITSVRC